MHRILLTAFVALSTQLFGVTDSLARSHFDEEKRHDSGSVGSGHRDSSSGRSQYLIHETAEIALALDRFSATLGSRGGVASFETPVGSGNQHLFWVGLWVGGILGNDTLVSTGLDGWSSWGEEFVSDNSEINDYSNYTDHTGTWRVFADTTVVGIDPDWSGRPHVPLGVKVRHRSHSWCQEPEAGTVLHDVIITNIGEGVIGDGFIGLYVDGDVHHDEASMQGALDDLSGSLPNQRVAYIIDNDGDLYSDHPVPKALAVKFVYTSFPDPVTNFNWWVSNGNGAYDFGPRRCDDMWFDFGTGGTGTPEGDVNKYHVLSHPEWDYDQVQTASISPSDPEWCYPPPDRAPYWAQGSDARFLLSVGPFELDPDSSVRIIFATFTGESVHTDPGNLSNLPDDPDAYLSGLDFADILANLAVSDSLSDYLTSPLGPVQGLRHGPYYSDYHLFWDPWVSGSDDIDGYEVLVQAVPEDSVPYPGLLPPWLQPDQGSWQHHSSVGLDTSVFLTGLDDCSFHFASVRQTSLSGDGDSTAFVSVSPGRPNGPKTSAQHYYLLEPGEALMFTWEPPDYVSVAEYRVYRFLPEDTSSYWINRPFTSFYSTKPVMSDGTAPVDSFEITGDWYFYYECAPFAILSGSFTEYTDYDAVDGAIYRISAVNECGIESIPSSRKQVFIVDQKSRDILLLQDGCGGFDHCDSLAAFYGRLLAGFDHDVYWMSDTLLLREIDWYELMKYRHILVDGGVVGGNDFYQFDRKSDFVVKYMMTGGHFVHFGIPHGWFTWGLSMDAGWYASDWQNQYVFGVDSIHLVSMAAGFYGQPVDSLYGFSSAESVEPSDRDYHYDQENGCFTPIVDTVLWSPNSPPSVVVFAPSDSADVTHLFRSLHPDECLLEGMPVGVRHEAEWFGYQEVRMSLYGFHLWYMELPDMRSLIIDECDCEPINCCIDIRGNVDGDAGDLINVSDMTYLIAFLFSGGAPPPCFEEGDVNADEVINITDMTYLIAYLFSGGPAPAACP